MKRNVHLVRKICKNNQKRKDGLFTVKQVKTLKNFERSRSSHGRGGHTQQEQTTVSETYFSEILKNTARRRKRKLVNSKSPQVQHRNHRMQRMYSDAPRNDQVDTSVGTTDSVLWEYMWKVNKILANTAVLKIISDYDHRDRTLEFEKLIDHLEGLIKEGNASPMILKLWKKTLESKKKQLVEHQGVVSGTPPSSDDEDEEDDEQNSTICAIEPQRNDWMVSLNERINQNFFQNIPAPQHILPHKLITKVKPHKKSRSSKGRGVRTQQEKINYRIMWKKDKQMTANQQDSRRSLKFSARSKSEPTTSLERNHMEYETFMSRNFYGGGKRRRKDSDEDYDPNDARKQKKKKHNRKSNRRRAKGANRNAKRIAKVKAANSETNPRNNLLRPEGEDRS